MVRSKTIILYKEQQLIYYINLGKGKQLCYSFVSLVCSSGGVAQTTINYNYQLSVKGYLALAFMLDICGASSVLTVVIYN